MQVNGVSKMMGPIGPRGFNGSQGPPGPMGSIGPAGPSGTGDLSTCQYGSKSSVETAGSQVTTVALSEPDVSMRPSKASLCCRYTFANAYLRASIGQERLSTPNESCASVAQR